ncbi:MAG: C25 family cysteine peptidase [Verrucomicrobiota bacterium JB024]|nr:C25 family cysteine peptidase [Verrucomicrobiota bacterium JB024]
MAPGEVYPASSTNPNNYAGRLAEREAMKAVIKDYYEANPGDDWALVIIGHAPVAYSGQLAPDGHSNHYGAWPTDTYYADMQGSWPDSSVNTTSASDTRNWNVRGDGKFDRSSTLYGTTIQTGRVDMAGINEVPPGFSETMLLRQYLVRDHRFRHGLAPYDAVARRIEVLDDGRLHQRGVSTVDRYCHGQQHARQPRQLHGLLRAGRLHFV